MGEIIDDQCQESGVRCHVSGVTCQVSRLVYTTRGQALYLKTSPEFVRLSEDVFVSGLEAEGVT